MKDISVSIWDVLAVGKLKEMDLLNYTRTAAILENSNINQVIHYSNTKGDIYNNKTKDILFNVINHSIYHRGQIAAEWRSIGIEPVNTDYIFNKRKAI